MATKEEVCQVCNEPVQTPLKCSECNEAFHPACVKKKKKYKCPNCGHESENKYLQIG